MRIAAAGGRGDKKSDPVRAAIEIVGFVDSLFETDKIKARDIVAGSKLPDRKPEFA